MQYQPTTSAGHARQELELPAPQARTERRIGLAIWILFAGVLLILSNA